MQIKKKPRYFGWVASWVRLGGLLLANGRLTEERKPSTYLIQDHVL